MTAIRGRREQRTIHDVARRAKVSVGTVSKALNDKGRLRQETRERVIAAANDLDFRPERPRAKPASGALDDGRHSSRPTASAVSPSRSSRHSSAALPIRASPSSCATPPTIPRASGSISISCSASASTASSSPPPRRQARADRARRRAACRWSMCSRRSRHPDALCLLPDDEGGAELAVRHLRRSGPQAHRAHHRPGAVRGGAPARSGLRKALADAGSAAAAATIGPDAGPRPGAARPSQNLFSHRARRARRALLRQRPDRARRRRCAARARHRRAGGRRGGRLRQLGRSWRSATRPPLTSVDMNLDALGREAGRRCST